MNFVLYLILGLFYVINIGLIIMNLKINHAIPVLIHSLIILIFTLIFYYKYKNKL